MESNDFDGMALDNITVGLVPEPSTSVMLVLGSVIAALAAWKRRCS